MEKLSLLSIEQLFNIEQQERTTLRKEVQRRILSEDEKAERQQNRRDGKRLRDAATFENKDRERGMMQAISLQGHGVMSLETKSRNYAYEFKQGSNASDLLSVIIPDLTFRLNKRHYKLARRLSDAFEISPTTLRVYIQGTEYTKLLGFEGLTGKACIQRIVPLISLAFEGIKLFADNPTEGTKVLNFQGFKALAEKAE